LNFNVSHFPRERFDVGEAIYVDALVDGYESELSARNALNTAEIIFATYDSARRRGRVDLLLEITDNPLTAIVESGALTAEPEDLGLASAADPGNDENDDGA
jgi:hypothetical protein